MTKIFSSAYLARSRSGLSIAIMSEVSEGGKSLIFIEDLCIQRIFRWWVSVRILDTRWFSHDDQPGIGSWCQDYPTEISGLSHGNRTGTITIRYPTFIVPDIPDRKRQGDSCIIVDIIISDIASHIPCRNIWFLQAQTITTCQKRNRQGNTICVHIVAIGMDSFFVLSHFERCTSLNLQCHIPGANWAWNCLNKESNIFQILPVVK